MCRQVARRPPVLLPAHVCSLSVAQAPKDDEVHGALIGDGADDGDTESHAAGLKCPALTGRGKCAASAVGPLIFLAARILRLR
jgi:hypothetical protein